MAQEPFCLYQPDGAPLISGGATRPHAIHLRQV